MKNAEGAQAVEEALNGHQINGKALTVKINEEPETSESGDDEVESHRQLLYQKLLKPGEDLKKKRPRRPL